MRGFSDPQIQYLESKGINMDYFSRYFNPRRGAFCARVIGIAALTVVCFMLLTSMSMQSDWTPIAMSYNQTATTITTNSTGLLAAGKFQMDVQKEQVVSLKSVEKPLYYTIHTGEPYDMESAIRNVLKQAPDEIYTRDLLKPITSGGEAKLQEIGIRVRMFKRYFDPWEALHVVTDSLSETAFVRDDIIKYLRDTKNISAITDKPRAEAIRQYEAYRSFLSSFSSLLFPWTTPYFSDHMTLHGHMYNAGRGIVMSGNDELAPYMLTAISSFRALGCDLPVEVMYLGEDDLNQDMREKLEEIPNVATRDLKQMVNDQGWELEGWAGKAFATFMSSFREVILVDADVLFFRNPEVLFEDPGYAETGALFFRDRVVSPQDKKKFLRKILPKPVSAKARESRWWKGESSENQESGVIVVDKWRHFLSVFLTARLNGPDRSDDATGQGTYSFWWGDKETWWIGFELAGDTSYHFHQGDAGNMGQISSVDRKVKKQKNGFLEGKLDEKIELNVLSNLGHNQNEETDEEMQAPNVLLTDVLLTDVTPEGYPIDGTRMKIHDFQNGDQGDRLQEPKRDLSRSNMFTPTHETIPGTSYNTSELLHLRNVNFTLCSPQLLHLDTSGRPLWFNGWLQTDKFDHDPGVAVSTFDFFMAERRVDGGFADWTLGEHNRCCLKSDVIFGFTVEEKRVLGLMVGIGRAVGALSPVEMGSGLEEEEGEEVEIVQEILDEEEQGVVEGTSEPEVDAVEEV